MKALASCASFVVSACGLAAIANAQMTPEPPPPPYAPAPAPYAPAPPPYAPAPVPTPPYRAPDAERFSLIYSPEVPLSGTSFGQAIGNAAHGNAIQNIGLEVSTKTGYLSRYHLQLDYISAYGESGVRIEPLAFGWALPMVATESVRFELEPLISLADGVLLFTRDLAGNPNVTFLLSSGAEVQLNLALGSFYLFASPVGIELRYLQIASGIGHQDSWGTDWFYRFRAGLGVQY